MAKTKQTRRMIAMALAASVATSAVPVTAMAETVTNADGTTTEISSSTEGNTETKKEGHWRQPVTFKVGSSKGKPLTISRNSIVSDFPTHFKNERGI